MRTETISYQHADLRCDGYAVYDDSLSLARPGVLIAHDWTGINDFAKQKAMHLAELGYAAFVVDMYGESRNGSNNDEKAALMTPLMEDRLLLRERMNAGLQALCSIAAVDTKRVAVIGYCFGGLCSLDLARSGANVKAAISFHGFLTKPDELANQDIQAKLLALHGYNDPMVQAEQVDAFAREMTAENADWQVQTYSNTLHAFTNPLANDPDFGTVYNATADQRSWQAMLNLLDEVF